MKRYLFLLLSFFALNLYAQQGNLTGTAIAASDKEPMIGLTVLVKGTTNGTVTDLDGNYTLTNVPKDATIVFSMIGYKTQEVKVNGKNVINVVMEDDTQALDEVVVIGYGAVKKSDLTSSISAIKGDELKKLTGGNAMNALQGKINGVQITGGGGPGTSPRVIIRGVSTVNGSDPLYVVDGMPVGTNINFLDQNDIESMQILKDAAASAIYGAKGANGVIVITTKQGKKNDRVQVSYNGYFGVAKMANDGYGLLNAWEAMEFQEEGQRNLFNYRGGQTVNHAQFGSIGKDGTGHLTMPYAIKPAGYSKEQIISQYGSIAAWEASYKDNGENTWSRSAYYQMLEDGYSEEEARAGTNWYDEVVQTGKVQDHQISITGGGEKATYRFSLGYMSDIGTTRSHGSVVIPCVRIQTSS